MTIVDDVDVLIVGGGPGGLCGAIALARLGVRSVLVERHPGTAVHPKALHLSTRTMEVFRQWDLVDDVGDLALPLGDHGMFLGSSMADPGFIRHPIWQPDPSVSLERPTLVSQEILEPALRRHAEAAQGAVGGEVRFGTRLIDLGDEGDGVRAQLMTASGATADLRARWVIAADGAASTVRTIAAIPFKGHDVHRSVNIVFRADLDDLLADRRSAFYYVQNETLRGLLPVVDQRCVWRLHIIMSETENLADYEDVELRIRLIRAAVGVADLPVELGPVYGWTGGARVADRYRWGRAFLAGDAAHVNPPSGGLGMNLGIQDVHNLSWKLAAVVKGDATDDLLDSYETERRPVAVRTVAEAVRNHEFESTPVRDEHDRQRKHDRRRQAGLVLGHHYARGAFLPDGTEPPEVEDSYTDFVPTARPGHRAPHIPIGAGRNPSSLLDAFRFERSTLIVLVTGPDHERAWRAAGVGLPVDVVGVGGPPAELVADPDLVVTLYGIGPGGAVLVRPDGIVGARWPQPPVDANRAATLLVDGLAAMGHHTLEVSL